MDSIDKNILLALDSNCRLSYQSLADQLGLTANAIRKRFDRLIETGVIEEFNVLLRPAMMGSESLISLLYTDGFENEDKFIENLGMNPNVCQVGQIVTGAGRLYLLHCEYIGTEGLQNLGTFLRQHGHVTNVELFTTLSPRGNEFKIKKYHLRVLKHLLDDARMSVSLLSERVGLTARRVSNAIQEMQDSDAFWFTTRWNLSLGDSSEFYLKIKYDEKISTKEAVDQWLRETYPNEYWFSFYSAMEPVLFAKFVTGHFRDARDITRAATSEAFSCSVDVLLSYPVVKFPRVGMLKIQEMIIEAGLE